LLIVRDLIWHGKRTFTALAQSEEKIPSNILTERLQRLTSWGLVRRERYQTRPERFEYHLTDEGQSLEPVLLGIMKWGHAHLGGGLFDPKRGRAARR
jgi:DNA-binding HxlR family transcriptional regulator